MLEIIQCKNHEQIIAFINECRQLDGLFSKENLNNIVFQDLDEIKKMVFKKYQDTFVPHNSNKTIAIENKLNRLNFQKVDIDIIKKIYDEKSIDYIQYISDFIKNKYPNNYEEIFKQANRFISVERDQNKSPELYDEFVALNEQLQFFDTLLVGSGKPEVVINNLFDKGDKNKFDFYFAKKDLDFAFKNNKHIRFHSLLTKGANEQLFEGKTKQEILNTLSSYVKSTIDFVNEYNSNHKLEDGTSVINSIDLFNEILSFNKNSNGEYENIWETKYGINIKDICDVFSYAKEHKPDGVNYLYNEPFLEDGQRRKKVFEVLQSINSISNGLIDTLGSQMHITFDTDNDQIRECFEDFKKLQDKLGINIQITEFDLSLSEREIMKIINNISQVSYEQLYNMKKEKINLISSIINNSSVKLLGVSYWSLIDIIDFNLERIRTNLLNNGTIKNINEVPTVCGGLIPTNNKYIRRCNMDFKFNLNEDYIAFWMLSRNMENETEQLKNIKNDLLLSNSIGYKKIINKELLDDSISILNNPNINNLIQEFVNTEKFNEVYKDHESENKNVFALKILTSRVTDYDEKLKDTKNYLWDKYREEYKMMNDSFSNQKFEKYLEDKDVMSVVNNFKLTDEFKIALEETKYYFDVVKQQWDDNKYNINECLSKIIKKDFSITPEVYIVHPNSHGGLNFDKNKILWGHTKGIKDPNYNLTYLVHEGLHCLLPYDMFNYPNSNNIAHTVIELASDYELYSTLKGESTINEGHPNLKPYKQMLYPLWLEYMELTPEEKTEREKKDNISLPQITNEEIKNMNIYGFVNYCCKEYEKHLETKQENNELEVKII